MDPFTAAMNAFAAFNNFLVSPAGQIFANNSQTVITSLLGHFNVHLDPATLPPAKTPVKSS